LRKIASHTQIDFVLDTRIVDKSVWPFRLIVEHIELSAKLLDYFLQSNKSKINQLIGNFFFWQKEMNSGGLDYQNLEQLNVTALEVSW